MSFQGVAELLKFIGDSALLLLGKPKRRPVMKGIRWGENITYFPDMVLMGAIGGGKRVYRREGERMKIGDADIEAVLYGFYKDRLEDVQIHFRSFTNFAKLREIWIRVYGRGRLPNRSNETYLWWWKKFSMFLTYDEISGKGVIGCTYRPIYSERQQMKQNHKQYREMVEKFKMVKKEAFQSGGR